VAYELSIDTSFDDLELPEICLFISYGRYTSVFDSTVNTHVRMDDHDEERE